jgi:hypothetical protein
VLSWFAATTPRKTLDRIEEQSVFSASVFRYTFLKVLSKITTSGSNDQSEHPLLLAPVPETPARARALAGARDPTS